MAQALALLDEMSERGIPKDAAADRALAHLDAQAYTSAAPASAAPSAVAAPAAAATPDDGDDTG